MFTSLKNWLIGALVVVIAIASAFFRGRSKGKADQRDETATQSAKAKAEAHKETNDVEQEISKYGTGGAGGELRDEWMRDESDTQ